MNMRDQVKLAVEQVKTLFIDSEYKEDPMPEDMTPAWAWAEIQRLKKEIMELKKIKRGSKPKVEAAVRLLLEDPRLVELPIPMIAEIVREVFKKFGLDCKCSQTSVRWYMSQFTLEWDIKPRRQPRLPNLEVEDDAQSGK